MNSLAPSIPLRVPSLLRAALCSLCLAFSGSALLAQTSLSMHSDPGDYIGGGTTYLFTPKDGSFTASHNFDGGVSVIFNSGSHDWSLDFGAPANAPLKVGVYSTATRFAFHAPTESGLDISGDGRGSNTLTGSFEVKKIIYGASGKIISFWATFIQHSEGGAAALTGEIKYNAAASGTPVNQTPGVYAGVFDTVVPMTSSVTLAGIAGDDDLPTAKLTTTWALVSGPGTVEFAHAHALRTSATFSAPGEYVLSLTADDGALSASSQVTINVYDPLVQTSLTMASQPGDYIGQGQNYSYTEADGIFTASGNSTSGVSIALSTPDFSDWWYLNFSSPDGVPFAVGTYANATRDAFHGPTESGLEVYGEGRGSNTLKGSFIVKKIVFGPDNTVISFWATFIQHSEGAAPALTGEIKFNAAIVPGDFNGDGQRDIVMQDTVTGARRVWFMDGTKFSSSASLGTSAEWDTVGVGDFNDDGHPDLLLLNKTNGNLVARLMDGTVLKSTVKIGNVAAPWQVAGTADLNGDGMPDILLQNPTTGECQVWLMNGAVKTGTASLGKNILTQRLVGSGDFDGDGKIDILFQDTTTGGISVWYMNGTTRTGTEHVASVPATLQIGGVGDLNGDGKPDIILQDSVTGVRKIWLMDGLTHESTATNGTIPAEWQIVD